MAVGGFRCGLIRVKGFKLVSNLISKSKLITVIRVVISIYLDV